MGNIDYLKELFALAEQHPITVASIGAAIAAVAAFFKPIMRALQRALVRRIDQAWPDDGEHEERVRKTTDALSKTLVPVPRSVIEREVRKHKSTPPPAAPSDESGE